MRIALSAKRLSVYIRVQKGISYTIKLRSTLDRLKCFHGFSCLSNPKRIRIEEKRDIPGNLEKLAHP